MKNEITIFWFRRDLRLTDNSGLYQALKGGYPVLLLFVFDNEILDRLKEPADRRISFIYNALLNLQKQLIQAGSTLLVKIGQPMQVLKEITAEYQVRAVYANHDYEPDAIRRDQIISDFLKSEGIPFYTFKDQVIFEKSEIVKSDGTPYTVFTPYSRTWKQRLKTADFDPYRSENLFSQLFKTRPIPIPEIEETGFKKTIVPDPVPSLNDEIIRNYHLTRDLPYLIGTTRLGVHLRFGTVSIRQLVQRGLELNEHWLNELIWREFFMMILFHFPHVVQHSFKAKYDYLEWRNNEEEFDKWCRGETGFPIVDAGMREMNATGFMHNRVRMIVASFLTKHLLIDWRWGEAWFAEKLLDYELSSNNGNWQWAAGTGCDAAPYFRIFNPWEQTHRYDPGELYIRQWVQDPGGPNYPAPITDHRSARERALRVYQKAALHRM